MEHAVPNSKHAEHGHNPAATHRPAPEPVPHPIVQWQQQAGNQAMQWLLRTGSIHAKLSISQPGDPEEQEADAVADRIMRSHVGPAAVTGGCSCDGEDDTCDQCRAQGAVARKASGGGAEPDRRARLGTSEGRPTVSPGANRAINRILQSPGRGLDLAARAFFEPRFGHDFSRVQIHTDAAANASAQSIDALAYTAGEHVVFRTGAYSPETEQGRLLLAHELAHVAAATSDIHRQTDDDDDGIRADPTDKESWQTLQDRDKDAEWRTEYEENLSGAPQAALDLESDLKKNQSPSDADRDRTLEQIRTLIRMNAIGLMASNRAHVEYRRNRLLKKRQATQGGSPLYGEGAGADADVQTEDEIASSPEDIKNAQAIRAAAKTAVFLAQKREDLEGSARDFDLEATSQLRAGGDSFQEALEFMFNHAVEYMSPDIRSYLNRILESLKGQSRIDRGVATSLIFNMGRTLAEWRRKQATGVGVALNSVYEQFPFFAQLAPEDVPTEWEASSSDVMDRVSDAYATVLDKIDEVIVKIGAEDDIDPFDLPEAVNVTRDTLSPAQQQILDQAMQDRKEREFWLNMGLTIAQILVVFVPVVGPALSLGIAAGQLIEGVDSALTRYEISSAATNPEGSTLGVTGPSSFEWAMLGVQAALTAVELGGMLRELEAGVPRFSEAEPRLKEELPPEERIGETDTAPEGTGESGTPEDASQQMPETEALVAEEREPLQSGDGEARVTEEGRCEICHSPCKREVDMAREIEQSQLGGEYTGYTRNLTKRIQALEDAMVESSDRGALKSEYYDRFQGAFDKLSNEIDDAYERFVIDAEDMHFSPADEIDSFASDEPGSLFDDPRRYEWNPRVERALEGTAYHNKIQAEVLARLPKGSALTENNVQAFLRSKGISKGFPKKSTGIDLYIIDGPRKLVTPVDIIGVAGGKAHVEKLYKDLSRIEAAFKKAGYTMAEPFEIEYVGRTLDEAASSVVDELAAYARP
jgi:Domain of unknown function (DUF4157)